MLTFPTVDLTNCDREPIHVPGAVQPHGLLLALTGPDLRIVQVSANALDLTGLPPSLLLGRGLDAVLSPESEGLVREALLVSDPRTVSPLRLSTRGQHWFDGILHRSDGHVVLELEPTLDAAELAFADLYPRVRAAFAQLQRGTKVAEMCQLATDELASLTGFDRVMAYRFDRDGHGHVIAETRQPEMEPFLGLHYPASDIPAQARRLYTLNWLRLIVDVAYRPVPLVANDPETAPLDLSFAVLRSVSPIHVEYLRNMGVGASMSISLVVDGQLWGLVICHHRTPRFVPYEVRTVCEFLGQALSWQVASRERAETSDHRAVSQGLLARLIDQLAGSRDLTAALTSDADTMLRLVGATGVAVRVRGVWASAGRVPPTAELEALPEALKGHLREGVFATKSLREFVPLDPEVASGALVVTLDPEQGDLLAWFRPEVVQTVDWAGDPNKLITLVDGHARLSPRGSFALWRETVRACSLPWLPWQVEVAADLRRALIGHILRRQAELLDLTDRLSSTTRDLGQTRDVLQSKMGELARSEERYRTLFASIDDGYCLIELITDAEGKTTDYLFLEANASFEAQTGLKAPLGKTIRELAPGISPSWFDIYGRVVATGETVRFENHDAALGRWFDAYADRVGPPERRQVAIVFRDITTKKVADQERERLVVELTRSNKDLDQFAYVTSHDLKAPLRGIANLSTWIEDDLGDAVTDDVHDKFTTLRGRVQRLENLINGILSYSRAGRRTNEPEEVATQEMVTEVVGLLAPPAHVTMTVGAHLPTVEAERVPLQQVFMNLIGNAVKHTRQPGAAITINATDEGDVVHFTVADNGPGIEPAFHERIWGLFQKLESRDKVEGTGIGLAVVKRIVETQGGTTWVESSAGQGATFHVRWPKKVIVESAAPSSMAFGEREEQGPVSGLLDPARLKAIAEVRVDDPPSAELLDHLTRLAAVALGVPVSLVSFVDGQRQLVVSQVGLGEPWATSREVPLSHSFCKLVVTTRAPLLVEDSHVHPLVKDNPAVWDMSVAAYAGMPLTTDDGHVLGSLCAADTQPHPWTEREVAILKELAATAGQVLDQRRRVAQNRNRR